MFGAGLSTPEYGYSGYWNVDTISTRGSPGEDVLGAVAVMHVEVDDRDALESVRLQRVRGADRDVVEEAEAHRAPPLGVVARRAHGAERGLAFAAHHEVDRHARPRRPRAAPPCSECGLSAVSGSMKCRPSSGLARSIVVDVARAVHARDLLARRGRRTCSARR